jgi:RNA polymerase sigma-70 factor (ECF subfamily)
MLRRRSTFESSERFAAEVVAFLDPLYATALRLTRNRPDAEDLVQDTVVKALRFSNRFERGTNLKAWLYTILHNTFRNRVRDAGRHGVEANSQAVDAAADRLAARPELIDGGTAGLGLGLTNVQAALETPEQILLRKTLDADLQTALDSLPESFREAVWLRDVDEFSYAEIAKMLDIPMGTVMSRISRGRRLLFERLTHTHPAPLEVLSRR